MNIYEKTKSNKSNLKITNAKNIEFRIEGNMWRCLCNNVCQDNTGLDEGPNAQDFYEESKTTNGAVYGTKAIC